MAAEEQQISDRIIDRIINILSDTPDGLEVSDIISRLKEMDGKFSPRGVRNIINELVQHGKVIRARGAVKGPGAPAYRYIHPDHYGRQLSFFANTPGVANFTVFTRAKVEADDLNSEERDLLKKASSVLEQIADGYLNADSVAQAIIDIAPQLAIEDPIDIVLGMAIWTVNVINRMGDEIRSLVESQALKQAQEKANELNFRLTWAKDHIQRFWRLDRHVGETAGILHLPSGADRYSNSINPDRARIDKEAARARISERISDHRFIVQRPKEISNCTSASGTDASVADLFLEHAQGSFIPPSPVTVMTAAASQIKRLDNGIVEYQDFDIYPDELRDYEDHMAAVKGLVISPVMRRILNEGDFKHARLAAMDLRQYEEDLRVVMRQARWRPIGNLPALGIESDPNIVIRDGRLFPLVHRLKDIEDDGLYGQIVREEIKTFSKIVHNTLTGPSDDIVYASAVKNPQLPYIAPLVLWYLHEKNIQQNNRPIVEEYDVFRIPFADTAVSHLLFLGIAKQLGSLPEGDHLVTFRVVRRFSDIALGGEGGLPAVRTNGNLRVIDENNENEWEQFIRERIGEMEAKEHDHILPLKEYKPFIYLCTRFGVSMAFAAPLQAYQPLISSSGEGGHFLLCRLEIGVDIQSDNKKSDEAWSILLAWLSENGWERDEAHTQSDFDIEGDGGGLPVLVPNVIVPAHEAVTFARDKLGEEVEESLRKLISELRKRILKR
jgi:hypothetical protein